LAAIGSYDKDASPNMLLPKGEYVAHITASDYKQTSKGDGHYIMLTWCVLDGPFKGRTHTDRLNVDNPSKTARDIGNAAFAAVRIALFGDKSKVVSDTSELHLIPCKLQIDVKDESNVVKKYIGMGVNSNSGSSPSSGSSPPWSTSKTEDRF